MGKEAPARNDTVLLVGLTGDIRFGDALWFFDAGLILLAVGSIPYTAAIHKSGAIPGWTGLPLAIGLVLFLPRFYTPQTVRIAHWILLMAGCPAPAWDVLRGKEKTN